MVTQEVKDGLKAIYSEALLEAILFLYHNGSVTENEKVEPLLKTSYEELMDGINNTNSGD